jgi:hypothetical protein
MKTVWCPEIKSTSITNIGDQWASHWGRCIRGERIPFDTMLNGKQNRSAYGDLQACELPVCLLIPNYSNIEPEDCDIMFLQNVPIYLQDYAVSQNARVWTVSAA